MRHYTTIHSVLCFMLVLMAYTSCKPESHEDIQNKWDWEKKKDPTPSPDSEKSRFIWIDAAANFPRYANSKENIQADLEKVKAAGFTDIVVDVRPSMGDVLYKTDAVDQVKKLDTWEGSTYTFYERTATWDYLQAFIDAG